MTLELDTFLVALYTIIDDLYLAHFAELRSHCPGRRGELSDSEVLTLLIAAQWLHWSERKFLRYAHCHWREFFPRLLSQSAFNKRARNLVGVLVHLVPLTAAALGAHLSAYHVFDGVPVPLMRRCRGDHHRLFADEASIGKGGSDRDWYYGCQVLLVVTDEGVITGFVLAPASTEGHWLAEALLCWRVNPEGRMWTPQDLPPAHRRGGSYVGPTGPIWPRDGVGTQSLVPYIGDDGFRGEAWRGHWYGDYEACVWTPQSYAGEDAKAQRRQHSSWRQVVETVGEHLTHVFGLAFPGARSKWGLLTRVAAKLVTFNLGLMLNRLYGREDFAFATLFVC